MFKLLSDNLRSTGGEFRRQTKERTRRSWAKAAAPVLREICTSLVLLGVFVFRIVAQSTTGSIVGTVTDPSGALVPGATITVTDMGTNSETRTTTDQSGNYVVTPL